MAERKRGTQGRPMIYGKSPESRKYWNLDSVDTKEKAKTAAAEANQSQNVKKDTEKAAGRLHLHRKTASSDGKQQKEKQAAGKQRKRARSHGEQRKLRVLWAAFGVLCILLVAAMIYEIGLGNGTKLPGSERITQPTRQEQNKVTTGITLQKNQTGEGQAETIQQTQEVQTEAVTQTEPETITGDGQTVAVPS